MRLLLFPVLAGYFLVTGAALIAQTVSVMPGSSHIGVQLREIDVNRANVLKLGDPRGAEVMSVDEDGPAQAAGIKAGDVLLSFNGENIVGAQQLGRLVSETPAGRKVRIQYWREGRESSAAVTTAPGPARGWVGTVGALGDFKMPPMTDLPNPMMIWKNRYLGIECEGLGPQLADYFGVKHGVLVRSVEKGSAAESAGVRAGDVLTAVADKNVSTPRDLSLFLRSDLHERKTIPIELSRDRKPLTLQVPLGDGR